MKNFYMKHQDKIVIISDVMIIVLGLLSGKKTFALIGLLLLILSIYVFAVEKKNREKQAEIKAKYTDPRFSMNFTGNYDWNTIPYIDLK